MALPFALGFASVVLLPLIESIAIPAGLTVDLTTEIERLDQQSLPSSPDIPLITGPFYIEIEVQFYDLSKTWQRMVDFATDSSSHHIFLTKHGSDDVAFQYNDDNGNGHWLSADDEVTAGTKDLWRIGVDAAGLMTLHKNGSLLDSINGVVPPTGALLRTQQNLGMSSPTGSNSLDGVITNLKVQNINDSEPHLFRSLANLPSQVLHGSFIASVYVRFDETGGRSDQPVFDFRDASGDNVIRFRQSGSGTAVALEVVQDGLQTTCTTPSGYIVEEEMTLWKLKMNGNTWTIRAERTGFSEEITCGGMVTPFATLRTSTSIGESPGLPVLEGVVLGLRLDDGDGSSR